MTPPAFLTILCQAMPGPDRQGQAARRNPNTPHRQDWEGTFATMLRDARYKLVVYHRHPIGELFDLHRDPGEFQNLWQDPRYIEIKLDLIKQSFDALACAVDLGSKQTRHY